MVKLIYDVKTGTVIVSVGRGLGGEDYVGFGIVIFYTLKEVLVTWM